MNIKFSFDTDRLLNRIVSEFKCKEHGCLHPDQDGCDDCIVFDSVCNAEKMIADEIEDNLELYLKIDSEKN